MAKQHWKGSVLLAPVPPVLVSCGTMEHPNILTIAWTGVLNTHPPMVSISVRPTRYSYPILMEQREFVINLPTSAMCRETDFCGCRSGKDIDKFQACHFTPEPAQTVSAPLIAECPVSLECKIQSTQLLGTHELMLAEITAVNVEERYVDTMRLGGDVARVEVQAGDGVGALGLRGLLLDGHGPALAVELNDAEALGVVHVVAEDRGPPRLGVLDGARQVARQAVAVEDVVAEHERARLAGDEPLADGEGLRQAVRARLLCVGQVHAVARAVPEQALEVGEVRRRGDDQDVPDARQHEGGQRVVDHGLVVDRQQLLGGHERERVQARAGPAGEDDAFHIKIQSILM